MHKTLHKGLTKKYCQPLIAHHGQPDDEVKLVSLMREMKGYLQEAKDQLLQPRPEAIELLLKKAKEN